MDEPLMRTFLRSLLRATILAVLLIAAWGLVGPWLRHAVYAMRLTAMPAPSALAMPVNGVRPAALRDTWHATRSEGRRHEGIDIFARRGTAVRAATEGIVLRVGTNRLGGQVVWVLGPGGQRHYYAHLDRFSDVAPGMRVEEGRVLGYVGNTGNAKGTPPHLHYGVYGAGGPVNPYPLLREGPRPARSAKGPPSALSAAGRDPR
jgi:murein DD-endopeptidase MepM/ murein hydrolase activator NlpD